MYEAAAASGVVSIGDEPGEGPPGETVFSVSAAIAFLVACVALAAAAGGVGVRASVWIALPVAAAAYVAARFYAFDPYYAPGLRRASDQGMVPGWWVLALCLVALATAVGSWAAPRVGPAVGLVVVALCALTALAERLGH